MTLEQKRDWYYKLLVLGISLAGSVLTSYTAVRAAVASLESRMSAVERRVEVLDSRKLDVKAHDELVAWLKTISAENETSHREIREGIANIQRRRS